MRSASTEGHLIGRWVGVCFLAWVLSIASAEGEMKRDRHLYSTDHFYMGSLDESENWEAAAHRIFGAGESVTCDGTVNNRCKCVAGNCGCCLYVNLPKIRLVGNCCLNVSFLSENIGLKVTFSFNDYVLFEKEVSVRNPPPLCVGVPVIKHAASVCVSFYNLRRNNKFLCGCVRIQFRLAFVDVAKFDLGCFGIPIGDGEEDVRRANLLVSSFMEVAEEESRRRNDAT